ncbi:hypothetical protein BDY19DRAFT_450550 [Irpex rosettiformis]|uniref:Uncharacterized protein n=1 Tax=Irpex rosettiformis TaxID=378272 RepID=A0ACB8TTL0_9APHY|nr:hypothetical protein BDY19DRAFT_450550 [Irpex rosettiformis]
MFLIYSTLPSFILTPFGNEVHAAWLKSSPRTAAARSLRRTTVQHDPRGFYDIGKLIPANWNRNAHAYTQHMYLPLYSTPQPSCDNICLLNMELDRLMLGLPIPPLQYTLSARTNTFMDKHSSASLGSTAPTPYMACNVAAQHTMVKYNPTQTRSTAVGVWITCFSVTPRTCRACILM